MKAVILDEYGKWQFIHVCVARQSLYLIQRKGWRTVWQSKSKQYARRKWRRFCKALATTDNLSREPLVGKEEAK